MKWKKFICAISIISMLFSATQVARASYDYISKDTTNIVTISSVGIRLVYEKERADVVTVGQTINQTVAIENTGKTPVYVRLKFNKYWSEKDDVDASGNKTEGPETENSKKCNPKYISLDIEDDISWANDNWTYNTTDGYYYYKSLLSVGQKTEVLPYSYKVTDDVLEQITNGDGNVTGTKYKSEYQNMQGNVKAYGEAVQNISDDFIQDYIVFNSDNKVIGWKDVTIDPKSIDKPSVTPISTIPNETNVKFDEDASKFVTINGDNLFLNMGNMLPGDTQTQKINIKNSSDETVDIYLYAEPAVNDYTNADAYNAMNDLLNEITLKVGQVDPSGTELPNEIYNDSLGNMSNEKGEENKILLGTFKKGDNVELQASITLNPKWNIGNAETKIKWIFVCNKKRQNVNTSNPVTTITVKPPEETTQNPVITEKPVVSEEPEETAAPTPIVTVKPTSIPTQPTVVTKIPPVTAKPTIIPTEAEKTMTPLPKPTQSILPTDKEEPTKTPIPTPINTDITDVTITPLAPKPSKGSIGDPGLNDSTAQPIDKLPTRAPVEQQDNPKNPNGGTYSTGKPSPKSTEKNTKPYTNPKTGDKNRLIFWSIIFIISLTIFFVTVKDGKKQYRH